MSRVEVKETADGKIDVGGILIDASLLNDEILATLRMPMPTNWVGDASLTPALTALAGTTYEALSSDIQKVDARDISNLIQEAFLAAAGGTKPLASGASARPPVSARNTVFAKDEGRSWNTTALALLGHILISTKANERASALFAAKYKAADIWEMRDKGMERGLDEDSDVAIKVHVANRFAKSPAQFVIITAIIRVKLVSIVGTLLGSGSSSSSSSSAAGHSRTGTSTNPAVKSPTKA